MPAIPASTAGRASSAGPARTAGRASSAGPARTAGAGFKVYFLLLCALPCVRNKK